MQKTIIIIRGLSGAGKSTLADVICGDDDTRISVAADDFFTDEKGIYNFDPDQIAEAHEWCKEQVRTYTHEGYETICVANTFTKRWEVEPYLQIASEANYSVHVISLFDSGLNDAQLAARCIHNVPINSIRSQRKRWEMDVFREIPQHGSYGYRRHNGGFAGANKPYYNNSQPRSNNYTQRDDFHQNGPRKSSWNNR